LNLDTRPAGEVCAIEHSLHLGNGRAHR